MLSSGVDNPQKLSFLFGTRIPSNTWFLVHAKYQHIRVSGLMNIYNDKEHTRYQTGEYITVLQLGLWAVIVL